MGAAWKFGLPKDPGIYWFDLDLPLVDSLMVIKVYTTGIIRGYGDYGSAPIDQYYNPKVCPKAQHREIAPPTKWQDPGCIKGDGGRAWVRHPEGYLGFGLLRPGYNGTVGGTVLWVDHPTVGEEHGGWMGDEYRFCPVRIPSVK